MGINARLTSLTDIATGQAIDGRTGAFTALFSVGGTQRQAGVFVKGLAGSETVAVELFVSKQHDTDAAVAGDWMPCTVDGIAVVFSVSDNIRSFLVPGVYRLNCASAPAGAITAGVYY